MPDIEIHLTAEEARRLEQAAADLGMTAEELAADELRRRFALHPCKTLNSARGQVIPMHKPQGKHGGRR